MNKKMFSSLKKFLDNDFMSVTGDYLVTKELPLIDSPLPLLCADVCTYKECVDYYISLLQVYLNQQFLVSHTKQC